MANGNEDIGILENLPDTQEATVPRGTPPEVGTDKDTSALLSNLPDREGADPNAVLGLRGAPSELDMDSTHRNFLAFGIDPSVYNNVKADFDHQAKLHPQGVSILNITDLKLNARVDQHAADPSIPSIRQGQPLTKWQKTRVWFEDQFGITAKRQLEFEAQREGLSPEELANRVGANNVRLDRYLKFDPAAGAAGVLEGVAGGLEWLTDGEIGGDFANQMQILSEEMSSVDPNFLDQVSQGAGSMAMFFIPGLGVGSGVTRIFATAPRVANILGASTMTGLEAMTEAGLVWRDVFRKTSDQEQADKAANATFWLNVPLLFVTNKLGIFAEGGNSLNRFLKSAALEGTQEAGQEIISASQTGEEVKFKDLATAFGVGAIIGGGAGSITGALQDVQVEGVEPPTVPPTPLEVAPEQADLTEEGIPSASEAVREGKESSIAESATETAEIAQDTSINEAVERVVQTSPEEMQTLLESDLTDEQIVEQLTKEPTLTERLIDPLRGEEGAVTIGKALVADEIQTLEEAAEADILALTQPEITRGAEEGPEGLRIEEQVGARALQQPEPTEATKAADTQRRIEQRAREEAQRKPAISLVELLRTDPIARQREIDTGISLLTEQGHINLQAEVALDVIRDRLSNFRTDPRQGIQDVLNIGRAIFAEGKAQVQDFTTRMQEIAGDAWESIKPYIQRAWEILNNEAGQVNLFHGTPHDFDEFSLEAIGTGEGVQAFGWGLYFTDKKQIAKFYRDNLAEPDITLEYKGQPLDFKSMGFVENDAFNAILTALTYHKNIDNAIESAIKTVQRYADGAETVRFINNLDPRDIKRIKSDAGAVVSITLHKGKTPDQYDYMEWDKPLTQEQNDKIGEASKGEKNVSPINVMLSDRAGSILEQANKHLESANEAEGELEFLADKEGVSVVDFIVKTRTNKVPRISNTWSEELQEVAREMLTEHISYRTQRDKYESARQDILTQATGQEVYNALSQHLGSDKAASEFLLDAGIDGIQYPAGTLSGGGEGTNFVVFDPTAITIESKEAGFIDLNAEISLAPIIERLKTFAANPEQGAKDMMTLANSVWAEGKTQVNDFMSRMKEVLGDLFEALKPHAQKAWNIIANERGAITIGPEGAPETAASIISRAQESGQAVFELNGEDFTLNLNDPFVIDFTRAKRGGLVPEIGVTARGLIDITNKDIFIDIGATQSEQTMLLAHEIAHLEVKGDEALLNQGRDILGKVKDALSNNLSSEDILTSGILPKTVTHVKQYIDRNFPESTLIEESYAAETGFRAQTEEEVTPAPTKPKAKTIKVKAQIRQATGQVRAEAPLVREDVAFKESMRQAVKAARVAFREGRTEGVQTELERINTLQETKQARQRKSAARAKLAKRLKALKKSKKQNIAVDYQRRINELIDTIDLKGRPTAKTLDRLVSLREWLQTHQGKLEVPQERIDQLKRLEKLSLAEMTDEEVKEIQDTVNTLVQLGKLKRGLKVKYDKQERQKVLDELIASTNNVDPKKFDPDEPTKLQNFDRGIRQAYMNTLHSPRVADMVDGFQHFDGPNAALIKDFSRGESIAKLNTKAIVSEAMETIIEETGISEMTEDQQTRIMIHIRLREGAFDQVKTLMEKNDMTEIPELSEQESRLIEVIQEATGQFTDQIAATVEEIDNVPFNRLEGYVLPIKYEKEFNIAGPEMINQTRHRTTRPIQGFKFERVKGVKRTPRTDIFGIFEEAISEQQWYLNMQPRLEHARQLVLTEEYAEAAGDLMTNWWAEQLDQVARRGWSAKAQAQPALRQVRLNLNQAILGYKLSSTLIQPFAIFDAMAYMTNKYGLASSQDIIKEFAKAWVNPKYAESIIQDSQALPNRRAGEIAVEEVLDKLGEAKTLRQKFIKSGLSLLQEADIRTAAGVRQGILKALEKRGVENAKDEADFLMNMVSGSSEVSLRPQVLGQGELARTYFTFQSFMLNRWGIIANDIIAGGLLKKGQTWKGRYNSIMALAIFIAAGASEDEAREFIFELTTGKELPDENAVASAMLSLVSNIPVLGNLIEGAIRRRPTGPPAVRTFEQGVGGIRTAFTGKTSETRLRGVLRATESALAITAGIPGTAQGFDFAERLMIPEKRR